MAKEQLTISFEEGQKATRTTAERIAQGSRRSCREFNGTVRHLALDDQVIKELAQEGHLCFVNDDKKGHLAYLEDVGYRFVTNREAYGDREEFEPDARVMIRYGTADEKGTPQDIYLMLQPWEFYNEDQKALLEANAGIDKQIEEAGKDIAGGYGRSVKYEHK